MDEWGGGLFGVLREELERRAKALSRYRKAISF